MKTILYYTVEEDMQYDYAITLLDRRLNSYGISPIRVDHPTTHRPLLEFCHQEKLTDESFSLQWFPDIDPQILLHEYHTLTLDRSPEIAGLFAGQKDRYNTGRIYAGNPAGIVYAVLELCDLCDITQSLPLRFVDIERSPKLAFRSACLLLMKSGAYDIDICEEEFPWFYDRQWWVDYLDFLVSCRYNAVTIWNYFPFPYFAEVPGYAYSTPISEDQLRRNQKLMKWLNKQLARRNLTLVFHFYCIYVPRSFADAVGMQRINQFTNQQQSVVYDYISTSLKAFAGQYESIGFMPCLGEGIPGGDAERFAEEVLLAALAAVPRKPVLVVRQWASLTTAGVKNHLLGKYDNLYVMIKHNAEHIASEVPDGRTKAWINLGVPCLVNMHMISEVGPFRWAPTHFINRICLIYQAMGLKGIHVYPHWPWRTPVSGDTNYIGSEFQRDRLYHEAFGRYSFDPVRDQDEEDRFWSRSYEAYYGSEYVRPCLDALNLTARSLTRLQQHLWIHYDNHSVLCAGYRIKDLYAAKSMQGRKVIFTEIGNDLIPLHADLSLPARSWGLAVPIETSLSSSFSEVSSAIMCLKSAGIKDDNPSCEASYLLSDMQIILFVIQHLIQKIEAVRSIYHFVSSRDVKSIKNAHKFLAQSVAVYRKLSEYTDKRYSGISDVNPGIPIEIDVERMKQAGRPYHWRDILPIFEDELALVSLACDLTENGADPEFVIKKMMFDLGLQNQD